MPLAGQFSVGGNTAGSYDKVMFYQRRKSEIKRVSKDPFGPLGIAGLWCEWVNGEGISKFSYALLSTSTGKHPLMQHFQYKGVASRMPLILPEDEYETWLNGTPQENKNLLLNCPAAELKVCPEGVNEVATCAANTNDFCCPMTERGFRHG